MTRNDIHIRTMSEYSAQVAERITDAAARDDFLESATLSELVSLFTARHMITLDDIELVLGMAQGCLRAARILDGKGMDGEGLHSIGMDFLTIATNAYGHVLAMALNNTGHTKH